LQSQGYLKMKSHLTAALACALVTVATLPSHAADEAWTPGWAGTYAGSYVCVDGEHGFYLDVSQTTKANAERFEASGTLGFFPVIGGRGGSAATVAGSFAVTGTVNADGTWRLEPGEWLVEPARYGAAIMTGRFSQRADGLWQIEGKPLVPGNEANCSDLIATQFLP